MIKEVISGSGNDGYGLSKKELRLIGSINSKRGLKNDSQMNKAEINVLTSE